MSQTYTWQNLDCGGTSGQPKQMLPILIGKLIDGRLEHLTILSTESDDPILHLEHLRHDFAAIHAMQAPISVGLQNLGQTNSQPSK